MGSKTAIIDATPGRAAGGRIVFAPNRARPRSAEWKEFAVGGLLLYLQSE